MRLALDRMVPSLILLVAMIGAIVLTMHRGEKTGCIPMKCDWRTEWRMEVNRLERGLPGREEIGRAHV